ncbi:MAG: DUF6563 family protein [Bacteroidales bacterium]
MILTKKKLMSIIFLTISFVKGFSQIDSVKNGIYRNFIDFKNNSPFYILNIQIEEIKSSSIPELYKVTPLDNKISEKTIKKIVWGIYNNGTFYLNVERFGMAPGYIKFQTLKKYNYFKGVTLGAMKIRRDNAREYISAVVFAQSIATLSNGTGGANFYQGKVHKVDYILDMNSGLPIELTKNYVLRLIDLYEDLKGRLNYSEDEASIEDLLYYIDILNQRENFNSETVR